MTTKLDAIARQKSTFVANFEKLEEQGPKLTVLLTNVRLSSGELKAAHGWFPHSDSFGQLDLAQGDVIQFDAFTEPAHRGERARQLTDPTNLKKLPFDLWRGHRTDGTPEISPSEGVNRSELERLTNRERQVLEQLMNGSSNDQIVQRLGLSDKTVRNYVSAVYSKLGVSSRAEAVVWTRIRELTPPAQSPHPTNPHNDLRESHSAPTSLKK